MDKQDRRNTIVVAVVGGVLLGFILSMLMGVFGVGTMKAVPGWLQGVSGMVAVLVSVYAVYLVSKTLQATQKALAVTREMADDQRKIGDAQTRAWVYIEKAVIEKIPHGDALVIRYKNFGKTPALYADVDAVPIKIIFEGQDTLDHSSKFGLKELYRYADAPSVIAPDETFKIAIPINLSVMSEYMITFEVSICYCTVLSNDEIDHSRQVILKHNGSINTDVRDSNPKPEIIIR